LIYQKFSEPDEPKPPFIGTVYADYVSKWGIEYQLTNGTFIKKRINKGCVSFQTVKDFLKKIETKNKKIYDKKKARITPRKKLDLKRLS